MARNKVTIYDVARLARTSSGTVSRVLNGRPGVASETCERVMRAMEALRFTPDAAARALSPFSLTVALAFPEDAPFRPYYAWLRAALRATVEATGARVVEVSAPDVVSVRADAVVFARDDVPDATLDALERSGRSCVVVGRHPRASWVCVDDRGGMAEATRALLDAGHEDVGHLGCDPQHFEMPLARHGGYLAALTERGLRDAARTIAGGHGALDAYRAVTRAWSRGARFTALACVSDEVALGAMAALHDLGVRVPEDVSVVGFDGLPRLPMALTTARQDLGRIAREAVGAALADLDERRVRRVEVPTTLAPPA